MLSYHQHNEKQRAPEIITRLDQGENCALADAGMAYPIGADFNQNVPGTRY